jgi:hypothetical protein
MPKKACQLRKIKNKIMITKDFERCPIWPVKGEASIIKKIMASLVFCFNFELEMKST